MGGTLDGGRTSRLALEHTLLAAQRAGARTELFDVATLQIPFYVHGQQAPEQVRMLLDAVHQSDGLVWSTPLYHGSVSGVFKNLVDWLELLAHASPPYLTDKVVALICTAGGMQPMQGINAMEQMVRSLRGVTLPLVLPIERAHLAFDEEGQPLDVRLTNQFEHLGNELVRVSRRLAGVHVEDD